MLEIHLIGRFLDKYSPSITVLLAKLKNVVGLLSNNNPLKSNIERTRRKTMLLLYKNVLFERMIV